MKKYNHAFDIAFEVISENDGEYVTADVDGIPEVVLDKDEDDFLFLESIYEEECLE